jgi:hypothetical protein
VEQPTDGGTNYKLVRRCIRQHDERISEYKVLFRFLKFYFNLLTVRSESSD